jgi:hypothetical protein
VNKLILKQQSKGSGRTVCQTTPPRLDSPARKPDCDHETEARGQKTNTTDFLHADLQRVRSWPDIAAPFSLPPRRPRRNAGNLLDADALIEIDGSRATLAALQSTSVHPW